MECIIRKWVKSFIPIEHERDSSLIFERVIDRMKLENFSRYLEKHGEITSAAIKVINGYKNNIKEPSLCQPNVQFTQTWV